MAMALAIIVYETRRLAALVLTYLILIISGNINHNLQMIDFNRN